MITRRRLLTGCFAAGVAPWIVKAGVLMPVKTIFVPKWDDDDQLKKYRRFHPGPNGEIIYTDRLIKATTLDDAKRIVKELNQNRKWDDGFEQRTALRKLGPNVTKSVNGIYTLPIHPDWIGPIRAI